MLVIVLEIALLAETTGVVRSLPSMQARSSSLAQTSLVVALTTEASCVDLTIQFAGLADINFRLFDLTPAFSLSQDFVVIIANLKILSVIANIILIKSRTNLAGIFLEAS